MSIPKKLDHQIAHELRSILSRINVTHRKVMIDLDNETIEVEDDYSIDDILDSAGILTPDQARKLMDEVAQSREADWD